MPGSLASARPAPSPAHRDLVVTPPAPAAAPPVAHAGLQRRTLRVLSAAQLAGGALVRPVGLPPLAGPFATAAVACAAAALVLTVALRPDPLVVAGGVAARAARRAGRGRCGRCRPVERSASRWRRRPPPTS